LILLDWVCTNFSSNIQDLVAAADHLRTHFEAPACTIGHSLGGTAVLAAAPRIPECRAVACIGAPINPAHVLYNFHADISRIEQTIRTPIDEVVGINNAAPIFYAAKHPKSFLSLDSASHLLSNRKDADYVGSFIISTWAKRYIGTAK